MKKVSQQAQGIGSIIPSLLDMHRSVRGGIIRKESDIIKFLFNRIRLRELDGWRGDSPETDWKESPANG